MKYLRTWEYRYLVDRYKSTFKDMYKYRYNKGASPKYLERHSYALQRLRLYLDMQGYHMPKKYMYNRGKPPFMSLRVL